MDVKKLRGLNAEIENVTRIPFPHGLFADKEIGKSAGSQARKKMVVFFGNDMSGVLGFGIARKDSYVSRVNSCLDYIRKRFKGFDLYYKAHPGDPQEQTFLNLDGFKVSDDQTTAEIFLSKNLGKIRAVFAVNSFSMYNAYNMGLDTHAFYPCFSDVYGRDLVLGLDDNYFEMPKSFFIKSFDQELVDNSGEPEKDESIKNILGRALERNSGKVWFYCSFSEAIVTLSQFSRLIKIISPERRVGLIVSHHRRWDRIADYLNNHFDEIIYMPRIHYSLRPARLLHAIRVAQRVKNLNIAPGDIVIVSTQPDFVESCLVSYHKKNLRVGLTTERDFNPQYNPLSLTYTANFNFRFNKATWFYNKIFEPLLGLNRSLYLSFTEMTRFYFNRYQKPLNEIFDQLIIFRSRKSSRDILH